MRVPSELMQEATRAMRKNALRGNTTQQAQLAEIARLEGRPFYAPPGVLALARHHRETRERRIREANELFALCENGYRRSKSEVNAK